LASFIIIITRPTQMSRYVD